MSGMIILFGQKKGGVGKSFTVWNTAGAAAAKGMRVCIVDADRNASLAAQINRRNVYSQAIESEGGKPLTYIQCVPKDSESTLTRELVELAKTYDLVFVDTGGMENDAFKTSISVADKIYLPFQPSIADLEQLVPTIKVIMQVEQMVQITHPEFKIDTRLLIALVQHNDKALFAEALDTVKELLSYASISGSVIKYVTLVRKIQADGLTLADVDHVKRHPARAQYELLLDEILDKRQPRYERGFEVEAINE